MKSIIKFLVCFGAAVALLVFIVVAGVAWFLFSSPSGKAQDTSFSVLKGDTLTSIAEKLQEKNFLRSALSLRILYKIYGEGKPVQPGTYPLSGSMTPQDILTVLLSETQDVRVTLQEGWRTEEMAKVLGEKLPDSFDEQEFLTLAKPQEGKLFPDTYVFPKDSSAQSVFTKLTATFEERYQKAVGEEGAGVLPKKDTLILASLVEREGRGEVDSRIVSGILLNRLHAGMPLQVDATLQYASGYDQEKGTWWGIPSSKDKESINPYNTYKNTGLPPSPICNPSLLSIKTALKPDQNRYLYYIHDPQGKPHYAVTYEEHQANIATYLR